MEASTHTIAHRMAGWLLEHRDSSGRIRDPLHGSSGHYADGFAALAFALMHRATREDAWRVAAARSLALSRLRPPHSEFDTLAQLLLAWQVEPMGALPRLYAGNRIVSRNWLAMRALNQDLLEALESRPLSGGGWHAVLGDSSGLFNDAPHGRASPVAYHAKFCLCLALAARIPGQTVSLPLEGALSCLEELVSPAGALVPYGRSRSTLFGQVAALGALHACGRTETALRLLHHLAAWQQRDGHVPAVLAEGEAARRDWDVYVNNADYNAYACAMLLLLPELSGRLPAPAGPDRARQLGPLVLVRWRDHFLAVAGAGESAPYDTPFFCDYRYYGMQPLYWERDGQPLLQPPVYRWPGGERSDLFVPRWGPRLKGGFFPRVYSDVEVEEESSGVFRVQARSALTSYLSVPRWLRGLLSLVQRLLPRIPVPTCFVRAFRGLQVRRVLRARLEEGRLEWETHWLPAAPPGRDDALEPLRV